MGKIKNIKESAKASEATEAVVETESTDSGNSISPTPETESVKVEELTAEYAASLSDEELNSKLEQLEKETEEFAKNMQTKKYPVKVENEKNLRGLIKYLEKNVNWNHSNMPMYIQVYHGFKDLLKDKGNVVDKDGNIYVGGGVIGGVYQYLLAVTGRGYFEAKDYLKVLTEVGGPISAAMKNLADDNKVLRDMHTNLTVLDKESDARKLGVKVESTPVPGVDTPEDQSSEA